VPEVQAESPSARTDPYVIDGVSGAVVSWHPERGWLCSVRGHHVQPCEHTADLVVDKSILWRQ
jgi:hypothetical protein